MTSSEKKESADTSSEEELIDQVIEDYEKNIKKAVQSIMDVRSVIGHGLLKFPDDMPKDFREKFFSQMSELVMCLTAQPLVLRLLKKAAKLKEN